jgi:AcrR family transcriptional regulator
MRLKYHKEVKISRQSDRRANQKSRTRAALVEAAARLLRDGPPTVAEAADAARISRATAYRYFPTQEALLVEVADLAPVVAPVEDVLANLVGR